MFGKKRIKVCGKDSGFAVTELDDIVGKKNYAVGCIGVCKMDRDKFYGKIDGRVIQCDTKNELFTCMRDALG